MLPGIGPRPSVCCCLLITLLINNTAWLYGDLRHVLYPANSTGWFCGSGPNKDRPNLLYFELLKCATSVNVMASVHNGFQCPTTQVCVKDCPSTFWAVQVPSYFPGVKPAAVFNQSLCVPSLNLESTDLTVKKIIDQELCPFILVPTTPVLGRCFLDITLLGEIPSYFNNIPGLPPSINDAISLIKNGTGGIVNSFNAKDIATRIFEDFASSWLWIIVGLIIAMLVSLLFLLLLRFIAPVIVWVLILGVLGTGAYGIWHCYWEYSNYKQNGATITTTGLTTNLKSFLEVQEIWLAFLIIISIVEAMLLLTLIFLRTRILIAIALIQESSKAISHMMSVLLYPVVTVVLLMVCVAFWGTTALYLATSGLPTYKVVALNSTMSGCGNIDGTKDCDPQNFTASDYPSCPSASCIFISYNTEYLHICNVVAFLWCVNFVIALGHCTLAGAFSSYYWAFNKPADIPTFPVFGGFIRSLRYHVGSLAFGALILTVVQILRVILEYIDRKTRNVQNCIIRFIIYCMRCLWCQEKLIMFINRNAYIMIAIYGKNFCVSAKNALQLHMRNAKRVMVLDKVTDLLLFFGKLMVVGGVRAHVGPAVTSCAQDFSQSASSADRSRRVPSKDQQFPQELVQKMESKKKAYPENMLGLLRFIRNLHEHYPKDAAQIDVLALFPHLFGCIYKFAKTQGWNSETPLKEMFRRENFSIAVAMLSTSTEEPLGVPVQESQHSDLEQ